MRRLGHGRQVTARHSRAYRGTCDSKCVRRCRGVCGSVSSREKEWIGMEYMIVHAYTPISISLQFASRGFYPQYLDGLPTSSICVAFLFGIPYIPIATLCRLASGVLRLVSAWPLYLYYLHAPLPTYSFPLPRLGDLLLVVSILCIYAPPSTFGICMAFFLTLPIYFHLQLPTTCLRRCLPLVSSWPPHLCYLHGVPTLAPSHVANELFSSFDDFL